MKGKYSQLNQEKYSQYLYSFQLLFSTDTQETTCESAIEIIIKAISEIWKGENEEKIHSENGKDYFLLFKGWGILITFRKIPTDPREMMDEYAVNLCSFGLPQTNIEIEIGRYYCSFQDANVANKKILINIRSHQKWSISKRLWSAFTKHFKSIGYIDKTLEANHYDSKESVLRCLYELGETVEMTKIMESIARIPYLQYRNYHYQELEIENKSIEEITKIFSLIPKPEKIYEIRIIHCKIKYLPESIKRFKNLKSLNLDNNEFQSIPDIIFTSLHIKTLCMMKNQIITLNIPEGNFPLENLFRLK